MEKYLKHNSIITLQAKLQKPTPKECEDCGLICTDRTIEHRKRITPETHWMSRCMHCNLCKNPYTGKFEMTTEEVNKAWRHYLKYTQF